ncbi:MAG TPA: bifunctional acetate--CoA ligase family protein/GNAT family N-acetyltransferase [Candidatus Acidoferrales bacterium]|nr:bifunctional acetate--CoA ligase family protein/GNAT family N-acetyltransferase [Candidatus Acidoferrales bacterium]
MIEKSAAAADSVDVNPEPFAAQTPAPLRDTHEAGPLSLDAMFRPRSVAVIGATERPGSVGRTTLANLIGSSFHGNIYPVNPQHPEILGKRAYRSIGDVPPPVDLAVIVTPAATVPAVVGECVDAGVKAAVVISAGFRERGAEGQALEQQIAQQLRRGRMRLIGPNCLGVMNPVIGLNATFAQTIARKGNVAFLSQSGALLTAILDWSLREEVGFSSFVSTGSMLDVGWGDLIDYFGYDPDTQSILIYMESVGDARSFLSAAREVAMSKPIIVIKAGRTEAASKAASSHTGALTGSDEVFDAALRRSGVLRVQTIADVFHMAEVLGKQPRPAGPRLMILTNAGGPGVLATDALIGNGGELAQLSTESREAFGKLLPPHWSRGNPIDILGDADPERYAKALEIAMHDPGSDGLLAILAPQGMTDPASVANRLARYAKGQGKPLLASWMGGLEVEKGRAVLNTAGIPTFDYPDTAARAFQYMWRYTYHLRGLYETPSIADDPGVAQQRARKAGEILAAVAAQGRTLLTEFESKQILALYDIPTVPTKIARTVDEAVGIAREMGVPVVLKLHSYTLTHKTDVGGVKLDLRTPEAVRDAFQAIESGAVSHAGPQSFQGVTVQPMVRLDGYELILGSSVDPQFGPVLLFGSGGQLVEVYRDRALALPPLNTTLAQRLMEQTKIYKALGGVRGRKSVDLQALERLLVRFSYIPMELPRINEIDINPLLASPGGLTALDARIVLFDASVADADLPRPAIRAYPAQYVWQWKAKNGTQMLIRPIRPEDEPLMAQFHESLSEQSVFLRYFHMENLSSRVAHDRLMRKCFLDYDREMALVAEAKNAATGEREILGVGRLTRERDPREAELAVIVTDHAQRLGLGTEMIRRLIEVARGEKFARIVARTIPENTAMRTLAERFGFAAQATGDLSVVKAVLAL